MMSPRYIKCLQTYMFNKAPRASRLWLGEGYSKILGPFLSLFTPLTSKVVLYCVGNIWKEIAPRHNQSVKVFKQERKYENVLIKNACCLLVFVVSGFLFSIIFLCFLIATLICRKYSKKNSLNQNLVCKIRFLLSVRCSMKMFLIKKACINYFWIRKRILCATISFISMRTPIPLTNTNLNCK